MCVAGRDDQAGVGALDVREDAEGCPVSISDDIRDEGRFIVVSYSLPVDQTGVVLLPW